MTASFVEFQGLGGLYSAHKKEKKRDESNETESGWISRHKDLPEARIPEQF